MIWHGDEMDRKVIVVGGAGAVGHSYVELAEAKGANVAILDLATALEQRRLAGRPSTYAIDVANPTSVTNAFRLLAEQWGHADALVYASGFANMPPRPATDFSDDEWSRVIDVNLSGAFRVAQAARPLLLKKDGTTSMVLVSSSMAIGPVKGFAPYIASKAGLMGLARALALEFAPFIRVNTIAPSAMETPFLTGGTGLADASPPPDWFAPEKFISSIPMGRLAQPSDCAAAIDYLVEESSAFMTGQVIHINGGKQMP